MLTTSEGCIFALCQGMKKDKPINEADTSGKENLNSEHIDEADLWPKGVPLEKEDGSPVLDEAGKPRIGTGKRFAALAHSVHSPTLAAWIGRKKYGKKRFAELSAEGRRRAAKSKNEETESPGLILSPEVRVLNILRESKEKK